MCASPPLFSWQISREKYPAMPLLMRANGSANNHCGASALFFIPESPRAARTRSPRSKRLGGSTSAQGPHLWVNSQILALGQTFRSQSEDTGGDSITALAGKNGTAAAGLRPPTSTNDKPPARDGLLRGGVFHPGHRH